MDECKAPDEDQKFRPYFLWNKLSTIEMHLQVIQDSMQAQYKPANGAEDGTTANIILHLHPSDSDFEFRLLMLFLEYPSNVARSVHTYSVLLYLHTLPTLCRPS